ncbi:Centractin [Sarracenia purpurea var. burkii]
MTMNNNVGQFGDTTLTKVFVGGLAWETPKEALRDHFDKYGEILEAVVISDKITGRSKGYGFVTFKEPDAAKKACEAATPIINGRRANCNLASLGARRPRSASTSPLPQPALQGIYHTFVQNCCLFYRITTGFRSIQFDLNFFYEHGSSS